MSGKDLQNIFIREAENLFAGLEAEINALEECFADDILDNMIGIFHSIKDGSGISGYDDVNEIAQKLEFLIEMLKDGDSESSDELFDLLSDSLEWLRLAVSGDGVKDEIELKKTAIHDMINEYTINNRPGGDAMDEHKKEMTGVSVEEKSLDDLSAQEPEGDNLNENIPEKETRGVKYFSIKIEFKDKVFDSGVDPLMIISQLEEFGRFTEINIDQSRLPDLLKLDPEVCYAGWELVLETTSEREEIDQILEFVKSDSKIDIEDVTSDSVRARADAGRGEESRLGDLLVGKGLITKEQLKDVLKTLDEKRIRTGDIILDKGYAGQEDIADAVREQESLKMEMESNRMTIEAGKMDHILDLFGEIIIGQTAVTNIAEEEFDDENGATIRNALLALDRSIREFQEELMKIRMESVHHTFDKLGKFIVDMAESSGKEVELAFDGHETEFDRNAVLRIDNTLNYLAGNIVLHSIESPAKREKMGKKRAGLINVSAYTQEGNSYIDISDDGSGVDADSFDTMDFDGTGIDGIMKDIESMNASVEIVRSETDGAHFRIKVPLSMAMIEGMLVRVGENKYVIPLLSIIESLQPKEDDVKTVEGKGEVVLVRGEYITLIRLYNSFSIEPDITEPWKALVMIVESGKDKVGLMIDDLIGQQQIVIKGIGDDLSRNHALSGGASILGDGTVALILDIKGIVDDMK